MHSVTEVILSLITIRSLMPFYALSRQNNVCTPSRLQTARGFYLLLCKVLYTACIDGLLTSLIHCMLSACLLVQSWSLQLNMHETLNRIPNIQQLLLQLSRTLLREPLFLQIASSSTSWKQNCCICLELYRQRHTCSFCSASSLSRIFCCSSAVFCSAILFSSTACCTSASF